MEFIKDVDKKDVVDLFKEKIRENEVSIREFESQIKGLKSQNERFYVYISEMYSSKVDKRQVPFILVDSIKLTPSHDK